MLRKIGRDKSFLGLSIVAVAIAAILIAAVILTGKFQFDQADRLSAIQEAGTASYGHPLSARARQSRDENIKIVVDDLRASASLQIALAVLVSIPSLYLFALIGFRHRKLDEKASSDPLTGLPNRRRLQEVLAALVKDPGPGNELALLLIDVDFFKTINDKLGHDFGDGILKELSARIDRLPSNGRFVARFGGDEFAIVLVASHVFAYARHIAETLSRLVEEPFIIHGKQVDVSLSIGISYVADGCYTSENLFKNADLALYAVKLAGRRHFRFYTPKMESNIKARADMERDLRAAIASEELDLYFQPMVDLRSQEIVAYEALARWKHPTLGFVPPQQFIQIAEEIGEMRTIGDWIIRKACETAKSWPPHISVAINLSPQQFEGDHLVSTVVAILVETEIDPSRVEFEITESLLIDDKDHVAHILQELRQVGVRIALDDFGTGYSSLSYLHRFPIDKIKIDQSFVRDMATRPEAVAIIESIIFLAKKLGVVTTVEGIETESQAIFARSLGCNEAQGYYFAKPHPAAVCETKQSGTLKRDLARCRIAI